MSGNYWEFEKKLQAISCFLATVLVACDEFLSIHLHEDNYLPFGRWVFDKSLKFSNSWWNKVLAKLYIASLIICGVIACDAQINGQLMDD